MTQLQLKNHKLWQDLTDILENLDVNTLIKEHLEECDYKICGYWDEQDKYYEEITLPRSLEAELISSSASVTNKEHLLQLKLLLKVLNNHDVYMQNSEKLGELTLVYNDNLEFIDENWLLDTESPLLGKI
ncbi:MULTISPECIES: hypothetical protein [unclassified Tolypothrix]|uniref:hypothetical protein n=1 Tax=unclassified Tolypothrix TaxID=2649714 RepID=UPI0005EABF51|nr:MULTISPECIES: hypothetical protein [unclassified Tolypothrix]BAY91418.1 hypothetical protein NIES3275_34410 [Microchaete diplosiphon NIES-3275]EKF04451.1 hypothetical protein FDUTEX481_01718 [Tolypothrix sp. PCC 7601]MBE9085781.1 hypothetical protein [Tolypothrix sp. LEGE 11397]UYD25461.1 hypothetical protein HGR01_29560 [Tolypothrix sp. PCC 7712]UYD32296.1 hypothetical protein HG267_24995 [Tolypothrix sp. PCC 7601]